MYFLLVWDEKGRQKSRKEEKIRTTKESDY
jgi:hypothetical protein